MSRTYKDLKDWSQNERIFYEMCLLKGIQVEYEPETADIIPSINATAGRYYPTQYTPDFKLTINNEIIMVETKGFVRQRDQLIAKIADIYYYKHKIKYYMIHQAGLQSNSNKNFYLTKLRGIAHRGLKTKTFWELIGVGSDNDFEIYEKARLYVKYDIMKESKELDNYITDLKAKKATYTNIINETNPKLKKHQEALRKLENNNNDFILLQEWISVRGYENVN